MKRRGSDSVSTYAVCAGVIAAASPVANALDDDSTARWLSASPKSLHDRRYRGGGIVEVDDRPTGMVLAGDRAATSGSVIARHSRVGTSPASGTIEPAAWELADSGDRTSVSSDRPVAEYRIADDTDNQRDERDSDQNAQQLDGSRGGARNRRQCSSVFDLRAIGRQSDRTMSAAASARLRTQNGSTCREARREHRIRAVTRHLREILR